MACVDKAPATPEYKLLQLRQYLVGENLKCVERLGHSAAAYEAAKERLKRKFGGKRHQIALHLELDKFKPIHLGYSRDIEKFADLLDVTVVNLKEAGRHDELENGSLYLSLRKKLTEPMLVQYHQWIYENGQYQSVETMREFIAREAQFQTVASETICGFGANSNPNQKQERRNREGDRTYFGKAQKSGSQKGLGYRPCKVCNDHHGVWQCDTFKAMTIQDRWDTAKKLKLCYHCLGNDHSGQMCIRSRPCGVNNCKRNHNRLLHNDMSPTNHIDQIENRQSMDHGKVDGSQAEREGDTIGQERSPLVVSLPQVTEEQTLERTHTTSTVSAPDDHVTIVALHTVPVMNGNCRIKVNALLDEASTNTYINAQRLTSMLT